MEQQVTNFARFYAAFNRLPYSGDREELKRSLVRQFTLGRTDSRREVPRDQYLTPCAGVERMVPQTPVERIEERNLRRQRSTVLHLMQQYGIDTANWPTVDRFCQNPRLMGKRFCKLSTDELHQLEMKLRMILNKRVKSEE